MCFLKSNKRNTFINGHGVAGVGSGANCTDKPGEDSKERQNGRSCKYFK